MQKLLSVIFLTAVFGLLIAASFGFEWAGGKGVKKILPARIEAISGQVTAEKNGQIRILQNGENLVRGEIIHTNEKSRAVIRVGQRITIALSERTDISLQLLFVSETEIKIIRGRTLVLISNETEKFTISSFETSDSISSGGITAVRYDWLEKTEITPFDEFDSESSSEKEFYEWAQNYDLNKLKFIED